MVVNGAGRQLLARARFALNEDSGVGGARQLEDRKQLAHDHALPHQAAEGATPARSDLHHLRHLEAKTGRADLDRRAGRYHHFTNSGALPKRTVGAVEVLYPHAVPQHRQLHMARRDLGIFDHDVATLVRPNDQRIGAEGEHPLLSRSAYDAHRPGSRGLAMDGRHRQAGLDDRVAVDVHLLRTVAPKHYAHHHKRASTFPGALDASRGER